jgi:1-phosphofructokinase family hexose kinase
MFLTVCPNTALDKIIFIDEWTPGIPMRTNHMLTSVGGKGLNSAVVLHQLGADVTAMGFFAENTGKELLSLLEDEGVIAKPVWVGGINRISYIFAEQRTNVTSHVIFGEVYVSKEQKQEFLEKFSILIQRAQWAILAGTLPPTLNDDFYSELIAIANSAKVPVLIDSQKQYMVEAVKAKPEIVKMNREEFEWTFEKNASNLNDLIQLTGSFRQQNDIHNLVITLGKEGILAFTTEGDYLAKAPLQKVVNAAGAGDSVSSTLVFRLSKEDTWETALRWSCAVSAATVLTERTGGIGIADVSRILTDVEVKRIN